jgi:hypothetical protein
VVVMVHHWIGIEHQLGVDASGIERDLGVTLAAAVLKANPTLLLRPIAKSSVADLKLGSIINSLHETRDLRPTRLMALQ